MYSGDGEGGGTESRPETGDSVGFPESRGGSRGGSSGGVSSVSSKTGVPSAENYWSAWQAQHLVEQMGGGHGHRAHITWVGFLEYVGETHGQSVHVQEQLLLSLEHIGCSSATCKYLLVDQGLPLVAQRIRDAGGGLYMTALAEVCVDLLGVHL
ncbi:hypothetical protein B484DRAFT_447881 [Ochromonadaceae sp. CCMP2298]|nr:hypothetical protein B484DRAFT_447881 [Ochromonadaceae sp. CCMP2298]